MPWGIESRPQRVRQDYWHEEIFEERRNALKKKKSLLLRPPLCLVRERPIKISPTSASPGGTPRGGPLAQRHIWTQCSAVCLPQEPPPRLQPAPRMQQVNGLTNHCTATGAGSGRRMYQKVSLGKTLDFSWWKETAGWGAKDAGVTEAITPPRGGSQGRSGAIPGRPQQGQGNNRKQGGQKPSPNESTWVLNPAMPATQGYSCFFFGSMSQYILLFTLAGMLQWR